MIEVVAAESPAELEAVRFLILTYASALRGHPGAAAARADAETLPGPYAPPRGRLYLAHWSGVPAGCVALHPLSERIAEVKRMFVLSNARRSGVARALMGRLLDDARDIGYHLLRLGTLDDMVAAQQLYRDLGFVEIPRYRPDEVVDTLFFELDLTAQR